MSRVVAKSTITYAEYLEEERKSSVKHEFLRGEVHAMAGGTPEHAAVTAAFAIELGAALRGRPCRVYSSDLRVRVAATDLATYPDLTVICGELQTDAHDVDAATNPVLLVEVLSDSTEAYDRGAKAAHYRRIPSLREYVLCSQHEPLIEVQRRNEQGGWEIHETRPGQRLDLISLGVSLDPAAIYANPLGRG